MPWNYSDKVLKLFMDAVKGEAGTHMGELENPDGFGEHGSIVCGDALRFSFRVERHPTDPTRDIITQARYLTFGCTSAIAASTAAAASASLAVAMAAAAATFASRCGVTTPI